MMDASRPSIASPLSILPRDVFKSAIHEFVGPGQYLFMGVGVQGLVNVLSDGLG